MKASDYFKPAVVTLDSRDSKASQDKPSLIWGQLSTKMHLRPGTEDIFENQLVSSSRGLLRAPQNENSDNDQDHTSPKTVSCIALDLCAIFSFSLLKLKTHISTSQWTWGPLDPSICLSQRYSIEISSSTLSVTQLLTHWDRWPSSEELSVGDFALKSISHYKLREFGLGIHESLNIFKSIWIKPFWGEGTLSHEHAI